MHIKKVQDWAKKVRDWAIKRCEIGQKRCEIGQEIFMQKGAKLGKKGGRLGNKKVRNWAINLPPKKGAKLGKKGEKLDNGHVSQLGIQEFACSRKVCKFKITFGKTKASSMPVWISWTMDTRAQSTSTIMCFGSMPFSNCGLCVTSQ